MPEASTKSLDGAVSKVTRLRPEHSGVQIPVGSKDIPFLKVKTSSVIHPAWGSFPGVKRPECEADHSSPHPVSRLGMRGYTSAPPIRLHSAGRVSFLQASTFGVPFEMMKTT